MIAVFASALLLLGIVSSDTAVWDTDAARFCFAEAARAHSVNPTELLSALRFRVFTRVWDGTPFGMSRTNGDEYNHNTAIVFTRLFPQSCEPYQAHEPHPSIDSIRDTLNQYGMKGYHPLVSPPYQADTLPKIFMEKARVYMCAEQVVEVLLAIEHAEYLGSQRLHVGAWLEEALRYMQKHQCKQGERVRLNRYIVQLGAAFFPIPSCSTYDAWSALLRRHVLQAYRDKCVFKPR